MRKIIRDGEIVECGMLHVEDDQSIPEGDISVSLKRWQEDKTSLLQRDTRVGVRLTGEDDIRVMKDDLEKVDLIVLTFPKFADGRGYSQARILRDELGFRGEVRVIGDILKDQIFYLLRCGVSAFEVTDGKDLQEALESFSDFTVTYQAAADIEKPIYRR